MKKTDRMAKREALVNELSQLYRLRDEGKNVQKTIERLEEELCETCNDEVNNVVQKKTQP